ncbi:MAG: NigD-like C-terminal domain-containing protein [Rikenellaceae bacterium]
MRKIFLAAMSTALFATSCNKFDDNLDLPEGYHFVTVMGVGVDPTDDSDTDNSTPAEVYFMLDSKETFIVTENKTKVDINDLKIGERVITGVTLTENVDDSYNYTAKLYEVVSVILGDNATVATEEESNAIEDHNLLYIAKAMTLTQGYLNLLVGIETEKVNDIKFYLVDNQYDEPKEEKEGYLNLELRYDCAGTEGKGSRYEGYVSFDMESYREKLSDMDGILLTLKTEKSGTLTVEVDSKDLFSDEELE